MENNNMVMCHSLQNKQRENTEEIGTTSSPIISTPSTLSARGHPSCLTVPEVTKDKNETSISGAELGYHPTSVPSMLNR